MSKETTTLPKTPKLKLLVTSIGPTVFMQIVAQIGEIFFRGSNGVSLASVDSPEIVPAEKEVYLRGSAPASDSDVIKADFGSPEESQQFVEDFVETLREYATSRPAGATQKEPITSGAAIIGSARDIILMYGHECALRMVGLGEDGLAVETLAIDEAFRDWLDEQGAIHAPNDVVVRYGGGTPDVQLDKDSMMVDIGDGGGSSWGVDSLANPNSKRIKECVVAFDAAVAHAVSLYRKNEVPECSGKGEAQVTEANEPTGGAPAYCVTIP